VLISILKKVKGSSGITVPVSEDNPLPFRSVGQLYGKSIEDRPSADSVPVGTVFALVGLTQLWQSDGEQWIEL